MRKHIELLNYTCMSVGINTPEEIVDYAFEHGISAVAISDFHSVQAFPRAWKAAKRYNIKVIFGAVFRISLPHGKETFEYEQICYAKNHKGIENLYHLINSIENGYLPVEKLKQYQGNLLLGIDLCFNDSLAQNFNIVSTVFNQDFCLINEFLWYTPHCLTILGKIQKSGCKTCASESLDFKPTDNFPIDLHWLSIPQRSDKEWVEVLCFLGDNLIKQAVFDYPKSIADLIEVVNPLPPIDLCFNNEQKKYRFQNLYLDAIWKDIKKNTPEIQSILENLYPEFRFLKAGHIRTLLEQENEITDQIVYEDNKDDIPADNKYPHIKIGMSIKHGLFLPIPCDMAFPSEKIDGQFITHFDYHDLIDFGYEFWP